MRSRFRLYRRKKGGRYYVHDDSTGKQESLHTSNRVTALRLLHSRNEAEQQPAVNLQIARAYLAASDPAITTRTWQHVMEEVTKLKEGNTRHRWETAINDSAFDSIRRLVVLETRAEHFLRVLENGKVSTNVYLRRIHNFALDMNWLPWSVLPKKQWPMPQYALAVSLPALGAEAEPDGLGSQSAPARANRYGPKRADPSQGNPKHAYSPFENIGKPPPYTPAPGRDYKEGELVIKFAPGVTVRALPNVTLMSSGQSASGRVALTDNLSLNQALAAHGITELRPVFRNARPPVQPASVKGAAKPDLTRWFRAKCTTTAKQAIETLTNAPGIDIVEPDYLRKLAGEDTRKYTKYTKEVEEGPAKYAKYPKETADYADYTDTGGEREADAAESGSVPVVPQVPSSASSALSAVEPLSDSQSAIGSRQSQIGKDSPPPPLPGSDTDPLYAQSWHLGACHIPEAWAWLQANGLPPGGSRDIVVAVIATGVDYNHPDLAANMWTTVGENGTDAWGADKRTNGRDDDGNGFVDDVHGCNVVGDHSGNPMDDHGHGTHVSQQRHWWRGRGLQRPDYGHQGSAILRGGGGI